MKQVDAEAILLAHDNPSFLMYVGMLAKRLGYKVYLALEGTEALRVARERKPTIIVLDSALAGIDGLSCLAMIRNDAILHHIPIIMLGSGENDLSDKEIQEMNVQGYLRKPLNVTDFYLAIQQGLHHAIKRRHVRVPIGITAIAAFGGQTRKLMALNLSAEGIFLKADDPSPIGTEMDIVLTIDDGEPVELKGIVVSSVRISENIEPGSGMGIKFVDIPEDVRYRLLYVIMKELTRDISVSDTGETWIDDSVDAD